MLVGPAVGGNSDTRALGAGAARSGSDGGNSDTRALGAGAARSGSVGGARAAGTGATLARRLGNNGRRAGRGRERAGLLDLDGLADHRRLGGGGRGSRARRLGNIASFGLLNGADSSVRGDNLCGDLADGAIRHSRRALGDSVSLGGIHGAGGHDRNLSGRRLGRLSSLRDRADGSVQGDDLGGDMADRTVCHRRRAFSDGISLGGVHGAGGHDSSLGGRRLGRLSSLRDRAYCGVESDNLSRDVADRAVSDGRRAFGHGVDGGGVYGARGHGDRLARSDSNRLARSDSNRLARSLDSPGSGRVGPVNRASYTNTRCGCRLGGGSSGDNTGGIQLLRGGGA